MKRLLFLPLLISAFLINGCKKSQAVQATKSPGITGNVMLIDENDSSVDVNQSQGTIVSIKNSNPLISTSTDAQGNFSFTAIKQPSPITFVYSHAGYGTFKQTYSSSQMDSMRAGTFSGYNVMLHPNSTTLVNSLTGKLENDTLKFVCNVTLQNTPGQKYIMFFRQKNNPDVSPDNLTGMINTTTSYPVNNGDNVINICLCSNICKTYTAGDTLYMKAFGATRSYWQDQCYYDEVTNKLIFPSVNDISNSATVSFVIPAGH